jgi:hypothetical protein
MNQQASFHAIDLVQYFFCFIGILQASGYGIPYPEKTRSIFSGNTYSILFGITTVYPGFGLTCDMRIKPQGQAF